MIKPPKQFGFLVEIQENYIRYLLVPLHPIIHSSKKGTKRQS